jgi:hypothetical protein
MHLPTCKIEHTVDDHKEHKRDQCSWMRVGSWHGHQTAAGSASCGSPCCNCRRMLVLLIYRYCSRQHTQHILFALQAWARPRSRCPVRHQNQLHHYLCGTLCSRPARTSLAPRHLRRDLIMSVEQPGTGVTKL